MQEITRERFWLTASTLVRPAHTLLDVGPGIRPQTLVACKTHVCVEPYAEYADILQREHPECLVFNTSWADTIGRMGADSVDTVMIMDVIEHLEKEDGQALLRESERLARGQVIVFTPLGFIPQGDTEEKDAWGLDGTAWQVHKSGWLPEDFPGWEVIICTDYHRADAYGRPLDAPFGALLAVRDMGAGVDPSYAVSSRQRHINRALVSAQRAVAPPSVPQRAWRRLKRTLRLN